MKARLKVILTAAAMLWCIQPGAARTAAAGLIAYDGFNYTPVGGTLNDQSGGGSFGFAGPWLTNAGLAPPPSNATIGAGSLSSPTVPLPVTGNCVVAGVPLSYGLAIRNFTSPIGSVGSSVYISFLLQPQGTIGQGAYNGFFGLALLPVHPQSVDSVFIGKSGGGSLGDYVIEDAGGAQQVATTDPVVSGQTALMVVRIDFVANGYDPMLLYVDPTSSVEPAVPQATKDDFDFGQLSGLGIYAAGAFSIDELRVGDSFASVVPEPSTWALLTLGGLGIAGAAISMRRARRVATVLARH